MGSSDRETATGRPVTALPFRRHAPVACPPPAELALSLAWELGELDVDRVERDLSALSAAILAEVQSDPAAQLGALGEAVANGVLRARADGPLLIDRGLRTGCAHPLVVAVVLHEVGRRAGLPVGIVGGEPGHFVAHERLTEARVLDPASGHLVDAGAPGTLRWRCGHQLAAELLDLLQPRYERAGDLTRALQVARLRVTLPFDDMRAAEQRLRRVSARLN